MQHIWFVCVTRATKTYYFTLGELVNWAVTIIRHGYTQWMQRHKPCARDISGGQQWKWDKKHSLALIWNLTSPACPQSNNTKMGLLTDLACGTLGLTRPQPPHSGEQDLPLVSLALHASPAPANFFPPQDFMTLPLWLVLVACLDWVGSV